MFKQGEKVGYVGRILYRGDASAEFTPLEDLAGIGIELSLQRCNIEVARLNVSKCGSLFYTTLDRTRDLEGEYMLEVALVVRDNIVVAMQGAPLVIESSRLGASLSRLITVEEVGAQESQLSRDQDALVAGIGEYRVELMLTQKDAPLDEWDSEQGQSLLLKLGTIFKGDKGDTPQIILNGESVEPQEDGAVDLGDLALRDDTSMLLSASHTAARLMHSFAIMQDADGVVYFLGKDFKIYALSQEGLRDLGVTAKSYALSGMPTFRVLGDRLYVFTAVTVVSIYDISTGEAVFETSITISSSSYAYFLAVDCSDGIYINLYSSNKFCKLVAATNEVVEMTVSMTSGSFKIASPKYGNYTYSGSLCYNKSTDTFTEYVVGDWYVSGVLNLSNMNYVVVTSSGENIRLYDEYSAFNSDGSLSSDGSYSTINLSLYDTSKMATVTLSKSILLFTSGTTVKLFEYDVTNGVSYAYSEYDTYLDFTNFRITKQNSLFSIEVK